MKIKNFILSLFTVILSGMLIIAIIKFYQFIPFEHLISVFTNFDAYTPFLLLVSAFLNIANLILRVENKSSKNFLKVFTIITIAITVISLAFFIYFISFK